MKRSFVIWWRLSSALFPCFFITILELLRTSHFFNPAFPPNPLLLCGPLNPRSDLILKPKAEWDAGHVLLCASPSLHLCPLLAVASKLLDVFKTFETMSFRGHFPNSQPLFHIKIVGFFVWFLWIHSLNAVKHCCPWNKFTFFSVVSRSLLKFMELF